MIFLIIPIRFSRLYTYSFTFFQLWVPQCGGLNGVLKSILEFFKKLKTYEANNRYKIGSRQTKHSFLACQNKNCLNNVSKNCLHIQDILFSKWITDKSSIGSSNICFMWWYSAKVSRGNSHYFDILIFSCSRIFWFELFFHFILLPLQVKLGWSFVMFVFIRSKTLHSKLYFWVDYKWMKCFHLYFLIWRRFSLECSKTILWAYFYLIY